MDDNQSQANMVREFMLNIARQIALLDLAQMEAAQAESFAADAYWVGLGSVIHPTEYRRLLQRSGFEHARLQREVVDHLIAIRKLMTKLDDIARANQNKQTNP